MVALLLLLGRLLAWRVASGGRPCCCGPVSEAVDQAQDGTAAGASTPERRGSGSSRVAAPPKTPGWYKTPNRSYKNAVLGKNSSPLSPPLL